MFTVVMPYDYDGVQQVRDFGTWQQWRSYIKEHFAALSQFNGGACKTTLPRLGGGW